MSASKKTFLLIIILALSGLAFFRYRTRTVLAPLPPAIPYNIATALTPNNPIPDPGVTDPNPSSAPALPDQLNLKVPFTSQAPHQNWDASHEEFCEEASILMVGSYLKNLAIADVNDAEQKLLAIKDFEMKKFGFFESTTAEETATILKEFYGLDKVQVVPDPTILEIKTALAGGKVVIVPLAGREIGNPNYKQPGPLYHMLVIKGYQKNGDFITNDPGTRKGADYIYNPDVIMRAIHDWNGGNVDAGKKVMIVVG